MFGRLLPVALVALVTLLFLHLVAPSSAHAQTAVAEALFNEAKALMDAGNYDAACKKFAESQKLEPKPGTMLNLAVCNEKRGAIATAYANYNSVAALAKRIGQQDREKYARERAAALEARVCVVTVTAAKPVEGLTVKIDDTTLNAAALGVAVPIDPGTRTITASAPGMKPWSTELVVPATKDSLSVTIPELEPAAAAQPTPAPPTTPMPFPGQPPAPQPDAGESGPMWPLVIAGFAVAGAGVIVGAITGGMALSQGGDVKDQCAGDACPSSQQDALDEATTLANVSNAMFVIAGVGAVVGVIGFFIPSGDDDAEVGIAIGPGSLLIEGTF